MILPLREEAIRADDTLVLGPVEALRVVHHLSSLRNVKLKKLLGEGRDGLTTSPLGRLSRAEHGANPAERPLLLVATRADLVEKAALETHAEAEVDLLSLKGLEELAAGEVEGDFVGLAVEILDNHLDDVVREPLDLGGALGLAPENLSSLMSVFLQFLVFAGRLTYGGIRTRAMLPALEVDGLCVAGGWSL